MYEFLNTTDWKQITADYENADRKLKYKESAKFKKLMGNKHGVFLDSIFPILASVTPRKNGDKYSASKTLEGIEGTITTPYNIFTKAKFREYFMFLQKVPPSFWMLKSQTEDSRFCRLVPIHLAAYKRYKNINYEEWNFSDENLKYFMNPFLFASISYRGKYNFPPEDCLQLRENAITLKDGTVQEAFKWPRSAKVFVENEKVSAVHPLVLTLAQLWVANIKYRDEYMVLDMNDWDNMPESLDVVASEVIKEDYLKAPF